ncbi:hypothetical protein ADUPG1_012637 [Aduncisulcus paluster]|uniref:Uncharacterized protein n=1 Tax=Aduncisulcus paluster TaxID=2918883 RepID=A0ABQ5K1Z9_9EUKA|nr:hypothetical protein ADUPG1_012637 [Aduncisulcus paluster]
MFEGSLSPEAVFEPEFTPQFEPPKPPLFHYEPSPVPSMPPYPHTDNLLLNEIIHSVMSRQIPMSTYERYYSAAKAEDMTLPSVYKIKQLLLEIEKRSHTVSHKDPSIGKIWCLGIQVYLDGVSVWELSSLPDTKESLKVILEKLCGDLSSHWKRFDRPNSLHLLTINKQHNILSTYTVLYSDDDTPYPTHPTHPTVHLYYDYTIIISMIMARLSTHVSSDVPISIVASTVES